MGCGRKHDPIPWMISAIAELLRMALLLSEIKKCCSVTPSYPTLCDCKDRSTPGFPVFHHILKLAQTQVHWVTDAIQQYHSPSSPSPPAFDLSQPQGLFQRAGSLHQVAKVLELQPHAEVEVKVTVGVGDLDCLWMLNLRCTWDFYMEISSGSWVKGLEFMLKISDFESP